MKKIILIFAATATLLVMGVGCKNPDTNRQEEGRDNISEEFSNEIGEIIKKDTDELFEEKFKLALQDFPGANAGEVFRDPQNKNKFYFVTNATVVANMPNNDGAGIYVYDLTKDKTYQENGTINVKEGSTELLYKMISQQKVLIGIGVLENKFGFELASRGYSLPKESCDSPWIYGMNLEYLDLGVPNPTPQVFVLSKDLEKAEQQKTADCQKALATPSLSADKKSIVADGKVLLAIDNDTIFNWLKIRSQLCGGGNLTSTPDRKEFCENKTSFKNQARFASVVVSPDKMKIGFTIESNMLSPGKVVGIFSRSANAVNLLGGYYLGENEFIGFSPNGTNYIYQGGCFEGMCALYIENSETLDEKARLSDSGYADARYRTRTTTFVRWISDNEVEYKLGSELKRASF